MSAPNKPCNSGNTALNTASAVASSMVPAAMMLPALLESSGPWGLAFGVIGTLVMGGLAGAKAATASNC